jgi:hypothetical protein
MNKQEVDNYYLARKSRLLKDLDKTMKGIEGALVSHFDVEVAEIVKEDTRKEFEALIPELPYIGGNKNYLTNS